MLYLKGRRVKLNGNIKDLKIQTVLIHHLHLQALQGKGNLSTPKYVLKSAHKQMQRKS